jgi:hypothetical protein
MRYFVLSSEEETGGGLMVGAGECAGGLLQETINKFKIQETLPNKWRLSFSVKIVTRNKVIAEQLSTEQLLTNQLTTEQLSTEQLSNRTIVYRTIVTDSQFPKFLFPPRSINKWRA